MSNMKEQTFEEFLQDKHALTYTGTDDDMSDDFDEWVTELSVNKVLEWAQRWGDITKHQHAINAINNAQK